VGAGQVDGRGLEDRRGWWTAGAGGRRGPFRPPRPRVTSHSPRVSARARRNSGYGRVNRHSPPSWAASAQKLGLPAEPTPGITAETRAPGIADPRNQPQNQPTNRPW
jgi:hypothetical protein